MVGAIVFVVVWDSVLLLGFALDARNTGIIKKASCPEELMA